MAKYDWDKLKAKYISGNYKSQKEFADAEGINYDVLRRHAVKWQYEKSQSSRKKVTKIIDKTVEKIATKEADINTQHIELWNKILKAANRVADEELDHVIDRQGANVKTNLVQMDKLDVLSKVVEKAQKGHRLALGLDDKGREDNTTHSEADSYLDALKSKVPEVWNNGT